MKKNIYIIYFICIALLLLSTKVMATGVSVELIGKTEINAVNTSETIEIKVPDSSDAIGSIGGTITGTNITIEKVEGMNGFTVYDFNEENGKFTSANTNEDVKGKSVIKITYKMNSNQTSGSIRVSDITAANSVDYQEIEVSSVSKNIKLASGGNGEDNPGEDPGNENPGETPGQEIHIEKVELLSQNSDNTAIIGKSFTITPKFTPENTTDDKEITYTSSDESIATVDSNGNVKAIKEGTVTITATTKNGKTAQIIIKVAKEETKETKKDDPTVAKTSIPQTGEKGIIAAAIVGVFAIIVFLYKKNKDLKGI